MNPAASPTPAPYPTSPHNSPGSNKYGSFPNPTWSKSHAPQGSVAPHYQPHQQENGEADHYQDSEAKFFDGIGIDPVSISMAKQILTLNAQTREPTILFGRAGIGKTALVHQVRDELSERTGKCWGLWVAHLQNYEKEEIAGYTFPPTNPQPGKINKGIHVMNDFLPLPEEVPEYGILFFDEPNRAEMAVIKALFTLMEERKFGAYHLPEKWAIVMAANYSNFNYSVVSLEKDPAIRRRVCMLGLRCDLFEWLNFAEERFHPQVVEFVRHHGAQGLYDVGAHEAGMLGTNPASWEKVSDSLKAFETLFENDPSCRAWLTHKICGNIGKKAGHEFMGFYASRNTRLAADEVLENFRYSPENPMYQKMKFLTGSRHPKEEEQNGEIKNGEDKRINIVDSHGEILCRVLNLLITTRPDPEKAGESLSHLTHFYADFCPDLVGLLPYQLVSFVEEARAHDNHDLILYIREINQALITNPEYKEGMGKLRDRKRTARENLASLKEKNAELLERFKNAFEKEEGEGDGDGNNDSEEEEEA